MQKFRAAAVQMRTGLDVVANLADAERLIREATADGADYVLTPEMTTVLDRQRERLLGAITDEAADPSLKRFRALAAELGIHLHIGSMAILAVYLRQRGSPESKPVGEAHGHTGVTG